MWANNGFFADKCCDFSPEKANLLENTLFYVNQEYQSYKDGKKCYYNDIYIVAQIMPLVHQPKEIESYDCKEHEVKILRTKYNPAPRTFLGIEYCIALITVKNDPEEQFLKPIQKCSIPLEKVRFRAVLRQPLLELIKISTKVKCFLNKIFLKSFSIYPPPSTDVRKSTSI